MDGLKSLRFLPFVLILGCGPKGPPPEVVHIVPAETPVRLALLQSVESGRENPGDPVRAMLLEPIRAQDGTEVAPAGTVATGKVARSRGATTFTAVANQPARLEVRFSALPTPGGGQIALGVPGQKPDEAYELTRGNTSVASDAPKLAESLPEPQHAALKKLQETFEKPSNVTSLSESDLTALKELSESLGLGKLGEAADGKGPKSVNELVQSLAGGASLASGGSAGMALAAAGQLLDLAGAATRTLGGMLKGANIKAPVGTRIELRVASEARIKSSL